MVGNLSSGGYTINYTPNPKGNLDNNQFQPNQLHDVADDTVAPNDAENRANHDNKNIVHLMNNREWTNEQKHRIAEIDMLEQRRGKNFMR